MLFIWNPPQPKTQPGHLPSTSPIASPPTPTVSFLHLYLYPHPQPHFHTCVFYLTHSLTPITVPSLIYLIHSPTSTPLSSTLTHSLTHTCAIYPFPELYPQLQPHSTYIVWKPQCCLQLHPVLFHAGGEILVAFVDGRHPWLYAWRMRMTLLHQTIRQLQQQLHLLPRLLQQHQQQSSNNVL